MWKPKTKDLAKAISDGCNFIVCHESIATRTINSSRREEVHFAIKEEHKRFQLIKDNKITIYRCHDLWDRLERIGVRDTWRSFLFSNDEIIISSYPYYITKINPIKLSDLAAYILEKIKSLGQNGVLLSGDPSRVVSRIATGTGVCVDTVAMKTLGADVGIITDDYYQYVRQGILSEEIDFPTIAVNHNISEEKAIENMYFYLQSTFRCLDVNYYKQTCPYKVIS